MSEQESSTQRPSHMLLPDEGIYDIVGLVDRNEFVRLGPERPYQEPRTSGFLISTMSLPSI